MKQPANNIRDAGPAAMAAPPDHWDLVDEESDESFPASDPPSWSPGHSPAFQQRELRMDAITKLSRREASFSGRGNLNIAYRVWTPATIPTAVMLIVPGFNSHSAYFDWPAEQLSGLGFVSFGVDLRGRGKSDGERFYVEAFDDYVSDVEGLMAVAKAEYPGLANAVSVARQGKGAMHKESRGDALRCRKEHVNRNFCRRRGGGLPVHGNGYRCTETLRGF